MNIFYLDRDPKIAAQMMCDKHVVKMILESAQILSTAHRVLDGGDYADQYGLYKIAHKNHPSTIWCRQSKPHYEWLYNHMIALGREYNKRYGKIHLSITKCANVLKYVPGGIYDNGFTQPPQAMPDKYKDKCSIQAYWNYYIGEKHVVVNLNKEKPYEQRPQETY